MQRRYEILLPLRFNDGREVPDALIAGTLLDLREQFGVVSSETQIIQGQWQHQGASYRDDMMRVFVDVEDTAGNRQYFLRLKEILKARFGQLEIRVTSHPIDVL